MTLQYPVLELDADFGGSIGKVTGTFEMYGDTKVTENLRTGFLIGGRGSSVNGIIEGYRNDGDPTRKGVHLDLGGGQHTFEVEFLGWEGATKDDGADVQWGYSSDPTVTDEATATGADPTTQVNVLMNYLRVGTYDSRAPGRLYWGEYTDGTYDSSAGLVGGPLEVAVESPSLTRKAGETTKYDGSLTLVETLTVGDVLDADKKPGY